MSTMQGEKNRNMAQYTVGDVAKLLGGTVEGDATIVLQGISKIEEGDAHTLTFLSNMSYEHFLYTTKSAAVLVNRDFVPREPIHATLIRVDDAYASLAKLMHLLDSTKSDLVGVSHLAWIHPEAEIDEKAYVAPFAYIEEGASIAAGAEIHPFAFVGRNARIGKNSMLYSGATVCKDCVVGDDCIIHTGAVVGADGFGFAPEEDGYSKIPQAGNVVLEDHVEIGANSCIDRAVIGSTTIRRGVKIDNLVQIGHNVEIGAHSVLAAQAGVAGSSQLGSWSRLGGQVGIAGHLTLADQVTVAAQSGVMHNVETKGTTLFGYPAQPFVRAMKSSALHNKLPEMDRELHLLRKEVRKLQALVASLCPDENAPNDN